MKAVSNIVNLQKRQVSEPSGSSRAERKDGMFFSEAMTFKDGDAEGAFAAAPTVTPISSVELTFIENLRAGDAAAYELLVEKYSGDIYALLLRLTSDADEASDLTQETFMQAFRHISKFRGDSALKTWLFRIAINETRNRFRWWKRRSRSSTVSLDASVGETDLTISDTIADRGISPEEAALSREREQALLKALSELKPVFREAIILADIEGLSYEECADAAGVNIGTVKSRISRGREELRKKLKGF